MIPYDSVKWLNRVIFDGYEFPPKDQMAKIRQLDNRLAKEVGWYIKEDDHLVGQVCYLLYPFKTNEGLEKTEIPLAVDILSNYRGKGYGKNLMNLVHEKMIEKGCKYSILATSRRWIAYQWCKKLGYIDLASLCILYGNLDQISKPSWSIRNYSSSDEPKLSNLFNEINKDNLGFATRLSNFITLRDLWKDKEMNIKILLDGEEIVGFVNLTKSITNEISELTIKKDYSTMDWLRFLSPNETMIFPSPHQCHQLQFDKNLIHQEGDAVLMIKDLSGELSEEQLYDQIGIASNRFIAYSFDRY